MTGNSLNTILARDLKPVIADFRWKYLKEGPACGITSWKQFQRQVRQQDRKLLRRLDNFPNSILVTGCQRSGTTLLTGILAQSEGMANFPVWRDAELDGALILAGLEGWEAQGRCCFQTTYLNEAYREYFEHHGTFNIVWVVRHPVSTLFSMLYHWRRFALNELFTACGTSLLSGWGKRAHACFGLWSVSRTQRACLAYNGKLSQLFEIWNALGPERCLVLEYEQLLREPERIAGLLRERLQLPELPDMTGILHTGSLDHAPRFSERRRTRIEQSCLPLYQQAKALCAEFF